jgi:hypothetical protein
VYGMTLVFKLMIFFFLVLRIKPRTSGMLSIHSITELYFQTFGHVFDDDLNLMMTWWWWFRHFWWLFGNLQVRFLFYILYLINVY